MRLSTLISSAAAIALLSACTPPPEAVSNTESETPQTTDVKPVKDVKLQPPVATRIDKVTEQVGRTRTDPYNWLKDDNWQAVMKDPSVLNADIRAYLEAENAFTKARLEDPTEALQKELFEEMRGRIKEDDSSLPSIDGPYAYLTRYRTGGQYPIIARKAAADIYNADAADTILLDGDKLGEGKSYFSFGNIAHSPDHKLVAYSYDDQGSEFYDIKFRDVETGKDLPDTIPATYGDFVFAPDSKTIYWVERDDNSRPVAVHQYVIGASDSTEIYREEDPGFFTGVSKSQSGEYIFITAGDHTTSEYHYFRADDLSPEPKLISKREPGLEYSVEHWDDKFVILTNADGAVDFKLMTAPLRNPVRGNWDEYIAHRPGTLILDIAPLKGKLVRLERQDGLPQIVVQPGIGEPHTIAFDEAAYDLDFSTGYEYDTDMIRLEYASPSTPDQVFDYNLTTQDRELRKTREVPSGHQASDYVVDRIMAPSHDGEEIPVTLLRHKDTPVDGTAPLLLYGYGSYGSTISADFRTSRLSLVDRGFIYAIAHVRGSQAKGYQWYLDGKLKKKENTFKDYISAGRYLVDQTYTSEGKVVGMGGSAGGLLMGAAANMDPELFGGIVAAVPFVDVVNTMSDTELPLTPPEWPEWGNPLTSAEDYDTILSYSPYDNVGDKPYPAMLITGGLTDPRVTYWEPAKWAAKLRHDAPNGGPYFLRINMDAGHGGASGRFNRLKETALEYAFALEVVGKADGVDIGD